MKDLVLVTQSEKKAIEFERILGVSIPILQLELPEIQSVDVNEVIAYKAKFAYDASGENSVIVEDTGLTIAAWNGLPGALIKWFLETVGVEGICQMMSEFSDRTAWATTTIGVYDGTLTTFTGRVDGRIAKAPAGELGFGWNSIFIPDGSSLTFAEMLPEEKDVYSMRRKAIENMLNYFSQSNK